MKKILIFASYFLPHKGGSEKYIYELFKRLTKYNYKIDIFTTNTEQVSEFEKIDGLNIYRVPCYHILGKTYPIPKLIPSLRLLKLLSKNKYNFINTQTRFWISTLYGYFFSKFFNIKLIHTEHGTCHTKINNFLLKRLIEIYDHTIGYLIIKSAWKNIGISKASCEFSKHLGANLTYLVPNGVDISLFKKRKTNLKTKLKIPKTYKIITFIGRLIYAKGVQDLIYVFPSIKEKYPKVKLLIVGGGIYKHELELLSKKNKDILFLGERKEIVDILNITDIFVNPSYSEGMPTTVLEAASVGIQIIATNVGGTKEIIDEKSLFAPKDKNTLFKMIIDSLNGKINQNNQTFNLKKSVLLFKEVLK